MPGQDARSFVTLKAAQLAPVDELVELEVIVVLAEGVVEGVGHL